MHKLLIDWDTCIGCGSCVAICPAVFELRDDEKPGLRPGQVRYL